MEEIKSKIATQFKTLEHSEKDSTKYMQHSTKIHARNKDSEVQKHVRYMEQQLETIEDKKYNVQDMMIDNNVEYEMVGESVNIRKQKTERYQELID